MIICPETDSAVHTIPASAMTKNIPVVPETPNLRRMTDETMIVSIVIPDTGLRAVVAIAFAATDAKKNEKASARASAMSVAASVLLSVPKKTPVTSAARTVPTRIDERDTSRSVRSPAAPPAARNAFAAVPNEPATIFRDFRIPKMPAVAIAPTPMRRTYFAKIAAALIWAIGTVPG